MNAELRENLIAQADEAFLVLASQIDYLLDSCQWYADEHPNQTAADLFKRQQLNVAIRDLGLLPRRIAIEIEQWKKGEERILSRLGVELQLIGELRVTIEATMMFLIGQGTDLSRFSLGLVNRACASLLRSNRLL